MKKKLTREESKLITRRRLIEAATRLLSEQGTAGLSASAVSRAAGIAQPTFYVHFEDRDDLLQTLAAEKLGSLRQALRDARRRLGEGEGIEALRDTFRLPLRALLDQPELFRLYVREYYDPSSPLGRQSRQLFDELRGDLVEDLVRLGLPATSRAEREQVEMMAESMIVQTQALGLGVLEGRYSSLEAAVDVLARFAIGATGIDPSALP